MLGTYRIFQYFARVSTCYPPNFTSLDTAVLSEPFLSQPNIGIEFRLAQYHRYNTSNRRKVLTERIVIGGILDCFSAAKKHGMWTCFPLNRCLHSKLDCSYRSLNVWFTSDCWIFAIHPCTFWKTILWASGWVGCIGFPALFLCPPIFANSAELESGLSEKLRALEQRSSQLYMWITEMLRISAKDRTLKTNSQTSIFITYGVDLELGMGAWIASLTPFTAQEYTPAFIVNFTLCAIKHHTNFPIHLPHHFSIINTRCKLFFFILLGLDS